MHLLKPRLSEKSYAMSQINNTYVLDVPTELNKHEIAAQVESQFDVKVKIVRIVNRKGKTKRITNTTGKRYTNRYGVRSDLKKAYVTLHDGSHLPFFEAEEAESKEEAKSAEKTKKATKPAASTVTKAAAKTENKSSHRPLLRSRKSGEK
jgi:large subunit ribosomal protein L23